MQASCPQCAHVVTIDDAKVPDRPFGVKCPRCQTLIRLPGRMAPAAPPAAAGAAPASGTVEEMEELFRIMIEWKASDLHVSTGQPPMLRHDGDMKSLPGRAALSPLRRNRGRKGLSRMCRQRFHSTRVIHCRRA